MHTKDRILASAMRLLDLGGPKAVTLRAVGDSVGLSTTAPYRHYEDKRALLEAMVRANLNHFSAAVEKAKRDGTGPFAALDQLVHTFFNFARRFPLRYRFMLEASQEDSALGAEARMTFGALVHLVRAAQQAGELRSGDPEQISALIVGAANGTATLAEHSRAPVASREASTFDPMPNLAPLLLDLLAARTP